MDANRRNLMKGMLTGGTLLALGIPPGAFASAPGNARRCGLLLENSPAHTVFAAGARTAHAAFPRVEEAGVHDGVLKVVKLGRGLLNDYEIVAGLLEKSRDMRWIAVLDDGSAAVFMELARNAGARLVLLGSHASSGSSSRFDVSNDIPELRHVWVSASLGQSAGHILASRLAADQGSFSIVENFFAAEHASTGTHSGGAAANGFVPGFLTWRLEGSETTYLHCSGVSPSTGCRLLGWDGNEGRWTPVSRQESGYETVTKIGQPGMQPDGQPRSSSWVESVGYAVMAAALGSGALQEFCSSRAFVHRPGDGARAELMEPVEKFTSFVIET